MDSKHYDATDLRPLLTMIRDHYKAVAKTKTILKKQDEPDIAGKERFLVHWLTLLLGEQPTEPAANTYPAPEVLLDGLQAAREHELDSKSLMEVWHDSAAYD